MNQGKTLILHITIDDKFVPFLQDIFEDALPGLNAWRIRNEGKISEFSKKNQSTQLINDAYYRSNQFSIDLQKSNLIIFHSMDLSTRAQLDILLNTPNKIPIIWRGWGFDYYSHLEKNGLQLLLPETMAIEKKINKNKLQSKSSPTKNIIFLSKYFIKKIINQRLISRIDYFSCCVPSDYDDLKSALPNFTAKFLPLNYYSKEDVFLQGSDITDFSGTDILLGNSATATNNHIEALTTLRNLGMEGRKVITPLNYGDENYKSEIIRAGKRLLGDSFVPLTEYMTLAEYNKAISNCGNVIMNHIRQQAIGNISAALLRGGKVFLRPESKIFKYYTQQGVTVFPMSDKINIEQIDTVLDPAVANENKMLMTKMWARKEGIRQVKSISNLANIN